MNYEQKYIKYKTKYISLRNKQDGGIHSYIWKYSGKDNRRDFSAENQILIQKGINSGARLILIEHIVAAGPDTGKRIMYSIRPGYDQIEELKINPDQTYTIFPTKLRYIYDAAVVVPVIPAIELQNEYYTADLGTFSYDPVNEQNMINYMIINNLESIDLFKDYQGVMTQFKITRTEVIRYTVDLAPDLAIAVLRKFTEPLLSRPIFRIPITREVARTPFTIDSAIYLNDVRLTLIQKQDLLALGFRQISATRTENERLQCFMCGNYEKTITLLNCGHLAYCFFCAVNWALTQANFPGFRDRRGQLLISCAFCVERSDRIIHTIYGGK